MNKRTPNPILLLTRHLLHPLWNNIAAWSGILILIAISLISQWNEGAYWVEFFAIHSSPREDKLDAFRGYFFELFSVGWLYLSAVLYHRFLLPLSTSFTVSETLWLRLSAISYRQLNLARISTVLAWTILVGAIGLLWVGTFTLVHGLAFNQLSMAIYGLTGYTLMIGGLTLFLEGSPTTSLKSRFSLASLITLIPFLFTLICWLFRARLDGMMPFSAPFVFHFEEINVARGFLLANLFGIMLLLYKWLPASFFLHRFKTKSST